MNRIITLRELSAEIAAATSISQQEAESFLLEFTSAVSDGLAAGEAVRIKGIGRFSVVDDTVIFQPDDELAEAVNMPFSAFEPIELDENLTEEMLSEPFSPEAEQPALPKDTQPEEAPDGNAGNESDHETLSTDADSENDNVHCDATTVSDDESAETAEQDDHAIEETEPHHATEQSITDDIPASNRHGSRCGLMCFFAIAACAGCFIAGYYAGIRHNNTTYSGENHDVLTEEQIPVSIDSVSTTIIAPDGEPSAETESPLSDNVTTDTDTAVTPPSTVTDTIRRGRFLTTMARQYYGRMEFWVYIYEENASKLGNPDRISRGTEVVIPPASKYDIDPSDPESIRRAEMKSKEIYAPYKK